MNAIIFDTETTDLLKPIGSRFQPKITEIFCLKVNFNLKQTDTFHTLFNPEIPIPSFITRITGIDDLTVANAPKFSEVWKDLRDFFSGVDIAVGHNLMFDIGVVNAELERIGKRKKFKWPKYLYCTVENSMHLEGYRLKNSELYKIATGLDIKDSHRAETDVKATFKSFKYLLQQRGITCI